MKKYYLLFFILCQVYTLLGQYTPVSYNVLDINNVTAYLRNNGTLWQHKNGTPFFRIPASTSSASALGGLTTWFAGIDAQEQLYFSNDTLHFVTGIYNRPNTYQPFDKIWKVKQVEIAALRQDFSDGQIDFPIAANILMWAGRNNPHSFLYNGFHLPSNLDLAPFIDQNNDGIYNPYDGDYPDIKGDQALWWIYNDHANSQPIGLEIHVMAYGFEVPNDPILQHTTFYEYTIYNKTTRNYKDFYMGLKIDNALGCPTNDHVGTSPNLDLAYYYQRTNDPSFCGNFTHYPTTNPMIGVFFIESLKDSLGISTGMTACARHYTPWAISPGTYFNFMIGKWYDGTPITYGGSGYNPDSTNTTTYIFPDPPTLASGWTDCTAPSSGQKNILMTTSGNLVPSGKQKVSFATVFRHDATTPCPDITGLVTDVIYIKNKYPQLTLSTEATMNNGINSVKNVAGDAAVVEL